MSNSVDPDETAHEPSHLDLCCLQKSIISACGSEKESTQKELIAVMKVMKTKVKYCLFHLCNYRRQNRQNGL